MDNGVKRYLPYLILFLICLAARIAFFGKFIDDWDGVNFAFALTKGYDALHDQPHFHGYPVYMFFCWLVYGVWHYDIGALILPGIVFSSLAIIPFYALVCRMFSRRVAFLAGGLYIVNPQIWLQAEKTLSDGFGMFFVTMSIYLLYRAIDGDGAANHGDADINHQSSTTNCQSPGWLFMGSLVLGLGIGVRVSYIALVVTWGFVTFLVCRERSLKEGILYGFSGLGLGVFAWLGYLLWRFGPLNYLNKLDSHSRYHFEDNGYSILTSNDYADRLVTILKNIFAHSLGVYWGDTPLIRLAPTIVMAIAIVAYAVAGKFDRKSRFLVISIGAYVSWLIVVQTAVRHTIVLVPFVLIPISAGVFYFVDRFGCAGRRRGWLPPLMIFLLVAPMAFDSGRLVWINRVQKPPQLALVEFVDGGYDRDTTKIYCLNTWKQFQYYAPHWGDRWNRHVYFTSRVGRIDEDQRNRFPKPETILVSSMLRERGQYKGRLRKVKVFERDNYAVAEYNHLALYEFDLQ